MIIPFDISIQQGGHDSIQYSSEGLRNLYLDRIEQTNKIGTHRFPGLKLVVAGSGQNRGDHEMAGVRYVVNGTTLYSETKGGSRTTLGTIAGTDRCIFADDGTNLLIAANGGLYRWSGSALSTLTISSISSPSSVDYSNGYFYATGANQEFAMSNFGDPGTWSTDNQSSANSQSDSLIRVVIFNELIYFFGSKSTEVWYFTGSGNPPIQRQSTALVNYGIAGKYAVDQTNDYMYWLDDERQPVKCIGSSASQIDTTSISHIIDNLTTVSDCIVSTFKFRKQWFVYFKFPFDGVDLVYSETYNYWFRLSSGTDRESVASWYGNGMTYVYDRVMVTDYRNGNSYYLDENTYTDNSDTILWQLVTRAFTAEDIGIRDTRRVTCRGMSFDMQTGDALSTGQGSDPVLMCELSGDGGQIYGNQSFVNTGVLGAYKARVDFYDFANGYEIRARIGGSDPVPLHIYSGKIDLVDGGY